MGGGLNLRGYAGYLAAETNEEGEVYTAYTGVSGTSASIELEFDRLLNWQLLRFIKMDPYLFADGGILVLDENFDLYSSFRMDAGIGSSFSWNWFGPLETVSPIVLRIDFPVFLNHAPFEENENFKFRYVVGLGRSF
jgi:aminopeptidase N